MTLQIHYTLNRASVSLKPKRPLIDWLQKIGRSLGKEPMGALDPLDENGDVFLVHGEDVIDSREDAVKWVEKNRTLKLFHEWFDIEYYSMVWDLDSEPLSTEDWLVD